MPKIVFTGPECSGKTTLATEISIKYDLPLIPEIARNYLIERDNIYDVNSLSEIGYLQRWQEIIELKSNRTLCCDTDLLTIIIWSKEKFGTIDEHIHMLWKQSLPDIYFLCKPDIEWISDNQRENPHDRDRLFEIHQNMLSVHELQYIELSGSLTNRLATIDTIINDFI